MKGHRSLLPWLVAGFLMLGACGQKPQQGLPYYRSKALTPEWVGKAEAAGAEMHRIPAFAFASHRGEQVTERNLSGRVTLVHFFYASCGAVCPRSVSSIKRLLTTMAADSTFQVLSYTVQPERDSVAALAAYASHHGIADARWQLLTAPFERVNQLATTGYFVNLRDGESYGTDNLAHTETLVLVDGQARIRGVYNATLSLDMEQIVRDARTLAKEGPGRPMPGSIMLGDGELDLVQPAASGPARHGSSRNRSIL
jgi:protein SCO1